MLNKETWMQLVDFGLLVFIWTIQLVAYPSFRYFSVESLLKWHKNYTRAVSIIVMPLMISQVLLHGWLVFEDATLLNWLTLILVISTWLVTFIVFVPLHSKISINQELSQSLEYLISYNWIRTILWSLIFFVGLFTVQK